MFGAVKSFGADIGVMDVVEPLDAELGELECESGEGAGHVDGRFPFVRGGHVRGRFAVGAVEGSESVSWVPGFSDPELFWRVSEGGVDAHDAVVGGAVVGVVAGDFEVGSGSEDGAAGVDEGVLEVGYERLEVARPGDGPSGLSFVAGEDGAGHGS